MWPTTAGSSKSGTSSPTLSVAITASKIHARRKIRIYSNSDSRGHARRRASRGRIEMFRSDEWQHIPLHRLLRWLSLFCEYELIGESDGKCRQLLERLRLEQRIGSGFFQNVIN